MKKFFLMPIIFIFLSTILLGDGPLVSFKSTGVGTDNDLEIVLHNIIYNDYANGVTYKLWAKFRFDLYTLSFIVTDAGFENSSNPGNVVEDTLDTTSNSAIDFNTGNKFNNFSVDESADISVEPWCVNSVGLCGNYVDIGQKSISNVTTSDIPATGFPYNDLNNYNLGYYCEPVLLNHTYINKNKDGSYTAFVITGHQKIGQCDHTVTVKYKNLN